MRNIAVLIMVLLCVLIYAGVQISNGVSVSTQNLDRRFNKIGTIDKPNVDVDTIVNTSFEKTLLTNPVRYTDSMFGWTMTTVIFCKAEKFPTHTLQILRMNIYQPTNDLISNRRLIILAHGGGNTMGGRNDAQTNKVCMRYAATGYVAVSIDYRIGWTPNANPAISLVNFENAMYRASQDLMTAGRFMKKKKTTYRVNMDSVILGGLSAGGFNTFYALNVQENELPSYVDTSYANLTNNSSTFKTVAILDCWGGLINLDHIQQECPPTFIIHGGNDNTVPCTDGYLAFVHEYGGCTINDRLQALGIPHFFAYYADAGHGLSGCCQEAYLQNALTQSLEFMNHIF